MTDILIINYFDWSGTRERLSAWVEAIRDQCEEHNVKFIGLYGPSQVKFNWAMLFESSSQDKFNKTWRELKMPPEVTHMILHYFWPETAFIRELPRYPPPHFFD